MDVWDRGGDEELSNARKEEKDIGYVLGLLKSRA